MTLNPADVYPRRNLPGDADAWGRVIEDEVRDLKRAFLGQKSNVQSDNRATASTFQELARQVVKIEDALEAVQAGLRAIPKPAQAIDASANFGLTAGWNTVVTTSLTVPEGANFVSLAAYGSGQVVSETTTSNVETQYRVVVPGVGEQPAAPGPWAVGYGDFRTILLPSYAWDTAVTSGQVLTAQFQVQPEDQSAYPPNAKSYAVITLRATFTGS